MLFTFLDLKTKIIKKMRFFEGILYGLITLDH